jgi:SAM-dependent methyltransferase
VTGIDISERGIEQARLLAAETGLEATFVVADVAELPDHLEGQFDVVLTSSGAINWLPDLPRWAEVVAHFVRPGGFFYIAEAHPFAWKMFPFMVETEPGSGVWRLPEPDDARLPLLFSLKATKP